MAHDSFNRDYIRKVRERERQRRQKEKERQRRQRKIAREGRVSVTGCKGDNSIA